MNISKPRQVTLTSVLWFLWVTCFYADASNGQRQLLFGQGASGKPLPVSSPSGANDNFRVESPEALDVRDERFGAKCDWNAGHGTDDTHAFMKSAEAASAAYRLTGKPVQIHIGKACRVNSTVRFGSGVRWVGPGTIIVPAQTAAVLLAEDADDVEVSGITINVITQNCGANNASCSAIGWKASETDQTNHHNVVIRDNTVTHSNWGILVAYAAGKGSLKDVEIRGNIITSPGQYQDADGIHVGGRVRNFVVAANRVSNRGDAGVAASSELPSYICSDGMIEDNLLMEDQIGLDNSGCRNTEWRGNLVYASVEPRGSNPAFRSIDYLGLTPDNVRVTGNYLRNSSAHNEYAAKVDDDASPSPTHVTVEQNTLDSPLALYLRGTAIRVRGNVFRSEHSTLTIDFNGLHSVKTSDVKIEVNLWQGTGVINVGNNKALLTELFLAPQIATRAVTLTHPGMFTRVGERALKGSARATARTITLGESARATANPGDCVSMQKRVAGLTTSDSIDVTVMGLGDTTLPSPFVFWGFAKGADTLVVRLCAVKRTTFSPATFRVRIH